MDGPLGLREREGRGASLASHTHAIYAQCVKPRQVYKWSKRTHVINNHHQGLEQRVMPSPSIESALLGKIMMSGVKELRELAH